MSNSESESVFVNAMEADPSRYPELVSILTKGNDTVIRHRDGFNSAMIAATPDQSRVVTVARWKRTDAMKALQGDPVVLEYARRSAAIARPTQGVFTLVAEYRPDGAHF